MIPEIITEEETGKEYPVKGKCHHCFKGDLEGLWVFNTSTGKMHLAGGDEYTLCGQDATNPQWLWQL